MDNNIEDNKSIDEKVDKREETDECLEPSTPSSTSWWSSWVQKSSDTFESIKKDLNELKETVQSTDTLGMVSNTVSNTASYVSQTMKDTISGISNTINAEFEDDGSSEQSSTTQTDVKTEDNESTGNEEEDKALEEWTTELTNKAKDKISSLIGTIADAFLINRNYYEDEDQMYVLSGDRLVAIERWEQLLAEIQNDSKTYINEPMGAPEDYESWLMTFNLFDYSRQMDQMLHTVPHMKTLYTQLVPNSLSDVEFWHRFYYRVHQLRESERKRIEEKSEDKSIEKTIEEPFDSNRSQNSVEIKILEKSQNNRQLVCNDSNDSSDALKSDGSAGSDDWEKTDIVVSDEDKDWVECE